jgi:glycine oxidase
MLPSPSLAPTDPLEQLRTLSHGLHESWAKALLKETGIDTEYQKCGGIYLATRAGESAALIAQAFDWQVDGVVATVLDLGKVGDLEPALRPLCESGRLRAAVALPNDCQVRNPRHLQALRVACQKLGVSLEEESDVLDVAANRGGSAEVKTAQKRFVADTVVLAGGAWTSHWLQRFGISNSIFPVRGQMVLLSTPQRPFQPLILEGNRYLVPRNDGRVLVGANEEEVGFERGVTTEVIDSLRQWAYGIVPSLETATVEQTWSGFRPGSIDGLPLIGEVPGQPGIYIAAGHFRAGLHLSCGTAVCLADLIHQQNPAVNLDAFKVLRGYTAVPAKHR